MNSITLTAIRALVARLFIIMAGALMLSACSNNEASPLPEKPNFLLIVVDDMAMADLSSFGGEIPTPNLDRLANKGVRFTNFHTSSVCSATRAMMLTGVDNHRAGFGNLAEEMAPNQKGMAGHEGELNDRVVTIASLLQDDGYDSYITGKWHLGTSDESSPIARGFTRSFTMLSGGASHFPDMRPAYHPDPDGKAPYRDGADMIDKLPDNFEYSSQFFVDQMIDYFDKDKDSDNPFFAYLAFTAPHWPLQAPDEAIAKYKGKYDVGYDVIRAQRLAKQKELGIIPKDATENSAAPKSVAWDSLSDEQKTTEAKAMEIYAAMIDEIDRHVGRLLDRLEESDELKDTVVIFISDNGAEGHDLDETWPGDQFPEIRKNIDERHDFSLENMGKPKSYVFYGPNWARAGSPAFRLSKAFPTEGGTRVSAFISHPSLLSGEISDQYFSVKDIMPTLLDMANIKHPGAQYKGRTVEVPSGFSMLKSLTDITALNQSNDRIEGGEILGKYMIRKGHWKMVNIPAPHGNGKWQLYNLAEDIAERNDLAAQKPEMVTELDALWKDYAKENGVILPDWVSGY